MRWLLLLVAGCGGFELRATVRADEVRVDSAEVSMYCPQILKANGPSLLGTTDRHGQLAFREHWGGRWIHDACELWVERAGYARYRVPVTRACESWEGRRCVRAIVVADLVRDGE